MALYDANDGETTSIPTGTLRQFARSLERVEPVPVPSWANTFAYQQDADLELSRATTVWENTNRVAIDRITILRLEGYSAAGEKLLAPRLMWPFATGDVSHLARAIRAAWNYDDLCTMATTQHVFSPLAAAIVSDAAFPGASEPTVRTARSLALSTDGCVRADIWIRCIQFAFITTLLHKDKGKLLWNLFAYAVLREGTIGLDVPHHQRLLCLIFTSIQERTPADIFRSDLRGVADLGISSRRGALALLGGGNGALIDWAGSVAALEGLAPFWRQGASASEGGGGGGGAYTGAALVADLRDRYAPRRVDAFASVGVGMASAAWEVAFQALPLDARLACILRTPATASTFAWHPVVPESLWWDARPIPIVSVPAHESARAFLRIASSRDATTTAWDCALAFLAACGIAYDPNDGMVVLPRRVLHDARVTRTAMQSASAIAGDRAALHDRRVAAAVLCAILSLQRITDAAAPTIGASLSSVALGKGTVAPGDATVAIALGQNSNAPLFDLISFVFQRFMVDVSAALFAHVLFTDTETVDAKAHADLVLPNESASLPWEFVHLIRARNAALQSRDPDALARWIAVEMLHLSAWADALIALSRAHLAAVPGHPDARRRDPVWWPPNAAAHDAMSQSIEKKKDTCPFDTSKTTHATPYANAESVPDTCAAIYTAWFNARLAYPKTLGDTFTVVGHAYQRARQTMLRARQLAQRALLCPSTFRRNTQRLVYAAHTDIPGKHALPQLTARFAPRRAWNLFMNGAE